MRSSVGLLVFAWSLAASAQTVDAPAGGGQRAASLGKVTEGFRAATCARAPCDLKTGVDLFPPPEALATSPKLTRVALGKNRHALHARVPLSGRAWEAVVVAPIGGGGPKVVFSGLTGYVDGEDGLRRGPMVRISEPRTDGTRSIVVGEQREDMTLCGRPAELRPKLLDPRDLTLKPAKVHRLSVKERAGADRVMAVRLEGPLPDGAPPLLRPISASSGVGDPGAVADGDTETTWAEGRGGSGRGEFLLMLAPSEISIDRFELVVRPEKTELENGVAPKEFFLVTHQKVFRVKMPEDAWQHPGARYDIRLPKPARSDCVGLVTHSAFGDGKDVQVTFAELRASTTLGSTKVPDLVAALAGGGPRAQAAGAVLRSIGAKAFEAVAASYGKLDEGGRRVALDVMDHAPCTSSVPVYVEALTSKVPAHQFHGRDRLRRCGEKSADALLESLDGAPPKAVGLLADLLAQVAPARAVRAMIGALGSADGDKRARLRVALARASDAPEAAPEIAKALEDPKLSDVAAIDLLRALGPRLPRFGSAAASRFEQLTKPGASFRTRYLLLGPAAQLAGRSPSARKFLAEAMTRDETHFIRARAAGVVERPKQFERELVAALSDSKMRVREAAAATLGHRSAKFAQARLLVLLAEDPWPLVRARVARSLVEQGPATRVDQALGTALEDPSHHVRTPVVLALGRRGALSQAQGVRDRLADREENLFVRSSAAKALGMMCDYDAVDQLVEYAVELGNPHASEAARAIGPSALWALALLAPPNLGTQLAPLLTAEGVPPGARAAARAAVASKGRCDRRAQQAWRGAPRRFAFSRTPLRRLQ